MPHQGSELGLAIGLFLVGSVDAHGAMLTPPPRNAIDSTIPGADWGNGTNRTGHLEVRNESLVYNLDIMASLRRCYSL